MAWLQRPENILKIDELKEYQEEQERLAEEAEEMAQTALGTVTI